jgi:hypothetical protein
LIESNPEEFKKRKRNKLNRYTKLMDKLIVPPPLVPIEKEVREKQEPGTKNYFKILYPDLRIIFHPEFIEHWGFPISFRKKIENEQKLKECLEK